jgi:prepilin-type N-terminal cleavage/methylation domain-containing protein
MRPGKLNKKSDAGFALIEVLLGLAVFAVGVVALGRAAQNCVNASTLSAEEERVRQILSNQMAEIQTSPVAPDPSEELQIDTGFGVVKLTEKSVAAQLLGPDNTELSGISLVTLTAQWTRSGVTQSRQVEFYVYRPG